MLIIERGSSRQLCDQILLQEVAERLGISRAIVSATCAKKFNSVRKRTLSDFSHVFFKNYLLVGHFKENNDKLQLVKGLQLSDQHASVVTADRCVRVRCNFNVGSSFAE